MCRGKSNYTICLQPKNVEDFRTEIANRLKDIEESSKKKASFDKAKPLVKTITVERIKRLDTVLSENLITADESKLIKKGCKGLKEKIAEYQISSLERVTSGNKIPKAEAIKLTANDFDFKNGLATRVAQIQEIFKKDNSAVHYSIISASKDVFLKIKQFKKKKVILEKHLDN